MQFHVKCESNLKSMERIEIEGFSSARFSWFIATLKKQKLSIGMVPDLQASGGRPLPVSIRPSSVFAMLYLIIPRCVIQLKRAESETFCFGWCVYEVTELIGIASEPTYSFVWRYKLLPSSLMTDRNSTGYCNITFKVLQCETVCQGHSSGVLENVLWLAQSGSQVTPWKNGPSLERSHPIVEQLKWGMAAWETWPQSFPIWF